MAKGGQLDPNSFDKDYVRALKDATDKQTQTEKSTRKSLSTPPPKKKK